MQIKPVSHAHANPSAYASKPAETVHDLVECPKCGSHNLEEIGETIKDEFDYEVKVIKHRHRFVEYTCLDCGATVRTPLGSLKTRSPASSRALNTHHILQISGLILKPVQEMVSANSLPL